jgi:hypothetical protein
MGECIYYGKAEFKTEEQAKIFAAEAQLLFERICSMSDEWQRTRNSNSPTLEEEFSDVVRELELDKIHKAEEWGPGNKYAGLLDAPDERNDGMVQAFGDTVYFSGTVWHLCVWDHIMRWFAKRGAIAVGYISEEEIGDLFSLVMMSPAREWLEQADVS